MHHTVVRKLKQVRPLTNKSKNKRKNRRTKIMLGMVRAEWMKVSRQGITRILMGLLAGISLLLVIGMIVSVTGTDTGSEAIRIRQEAIGRLTFPGGIFTGLALIKLIGLFIF